MLFSMGPRGKGAVRGVLEIRECLRPFDTLNNALGMVKYL